MAPDTGAFVGYSVRELLGHKRRVSVLAWSGNGRKLASGSMDQGIRIWPVELHQVTKSERSEIELKGHTAIIAHLGWKPGNQHDVLASVAGEKSDKTIRVWDVRSGKCSGVINAPCSSVYITWCPDGNSFATKGDNDSVTLYDVRKLKALKTHKCAVEVEEICWGPTAGHMLLATEKGSLDLVTVPGFELVWSFKGHCAPVYCMATSKSSRLVASGGSDALVSLWDIQEGVCVRTWAHMDHPVRSMSMSGDGAYLAYATELAELEVLSVATGERLKEIRLRAPFCDCVAWNPVVNLLAYCEEAPDPTDVRSRSTVGAVAIFAPPKPSS